MLIFIVTRTIDQAMKLLDVDVLDHLVPGQGMSDDSPAC
jgi:DNA repair protein RadC